MPVSVADPTTGGTVAGGVFPNDAHRSGVRVDAAAATNLAEESNDSEEEEGGEEEVEGGSARGLARVGDGVGLGGRRHGSRNGAHHEVGCGGGGDGEGGGYVHGSQE